MNRCPAVSHSESAAEGSDPYVEVTLSRTAENASAGIASIQIGKADLCLAGSAN
jgi:hypothetical protein